MGEHPFEISLLLEPIEGKEERKMSSGNSKEKESGEKKDTSAPGVAPSDKADNKSMLEAIEDDDDFEEFEPSNWSKAETEDETQQWMENWDDDMDDDFTKNLRAELQKESIAPP